MFLAFCAIKLYSSYQWMFFIYLARK
jgi:hypothetical protein